MTVYFVSRHPGAQEWAAQEGISIDRQVEHLEIPDIRPGDLVLGSLPVNRVAELCARGARYLHLSLDLTAQLRGRELSAAQMRAAGARLEEFRVERVDR